MVRGDDDQEAYDDNGKPNLDEIHARHIGATGPAPEPMIAQLLADSGERQAQNLRKKSILTSR